MDASGRLKTVNDCVELEVHPALFVTVRLTEYVCVPLPVAEKI
jgi:hypothetical protein